MSNVEDKMKESFEKYKTALDEMATFVTGIIEAEGIPAYPHFVQMIMKHLVELEKYDQSKVLEWVRILRPKQH